MKPLWGGKTGRGGGTAAPSAGETRNKLQHQPPAPRIEGATNAPAGFTKNQALPDFFRSFTMTKTNPIFAALSTAFVEELDAAYTGYFGDEYADSYFSDAVYEATSYAGNLEADFLPFMCDAADAYGDRFNEWVDSRVPVYTDKLAALWVELGCPEPESDCGGDITSRMRYAVYDVIAEQARDAADKLAELAADFAERYNAAEELAAAEADELEAAEELARRGIRSNYAGMYSVSIVVEGGCIVKQVFDTATAALDAVLDNEAAAAD